jgi:hypothetical protein
LHGPAVADVIFSRRSVTLADYAFGRSESFGYLVAAQMLMPKQGLRRCPSPVSVVSIHPACPFPDSPSFRAEFV